MDMNKIMAEAIGGNIANSNPTIGPLEVRDEEDGGGGGHGHVSGTDWGNAAPISSTPMHPPAPKPQNPVKTHQVDNWMSGIGPVQVPHSQR